MKTITTLCLFLLALQGCSSQTENKASVEELGSTLVANYIFLEKGKVMQAALAKHLAAGDYSNLRGIALAKALQNDIMKVVNDKHLRIRHESQPQHRPSAREIKNYKHGISEVQDINNMTGYIEVTGFHEPNKALRTHLSAQIQALAHYSNIVIDVRNNGGGSPTGVQLLCSYFFKADESIHLNTLHFRNRSFTQDFHVLEDLEGPRLQKQRVFILTSDYTFSGGEEFCYNLQQLGRATLIGEITGGGAHPVNRYNLKGGFIAIIPVGRAINPISGTNWEGTGVLPDIEVDEGKALEVALTQISQ